MANPDTVLVADLLRASLAEGQMPFLTVSSGSMRPLLHSGDKVGVQQVTVDQLRPGDVVVVCHESALYTHRFYGVRHNGQARLLLTRGDRVGRFDPLWHEDQLLGRAVVRRRRTRLLWLDYGRGRWLNWRLAQLARLEQRALMRNGEPVHGNGVAAPQRILRAGFRIVAGGLVRMVELRGRH